MFMSQLERVLEPEVMDDVEEAQAYDAMDHHEANHAFVTRAFELRAGAHILDIGTGPGAIPILLAQQDESCRVTAIDLADAMLAIARVRVAAAGLADRIDFQLADAKNIPFENDTFDTVVSNTILHHVPEPIYFLSEAARVLKPGGVLLIRDLFRPKDQAELEKLVKLYTGGCDPVQTKLFADSLHAALTPSELREAADSAGFGHAEVVVDTDRHMSLQSSRS